MMNLPVSLAGQNALEISLNVPEKMIYSDHLNLGGCNLRGKCIEVNNYYLSVNSKPVIPVTGEFHFSRYPDMYWEESIRKMKAGGIGYIATYVFWIIHEEKEGEFDWEGSRNLRKFVELCGKYDVDVIVRIGPFCHGEIRNGGLPDWLLGKPLNVRSNDPGYLFYVERLYMQIGKQLKGLLFRDGGPVVGIQLENEFQHSAAPWGLTYPGQPHDWTAAEWDREATQAGVGIAEDSNPYAGLGNEHMRVLRALAEKAGLEVPLYTATGWGNAAIIENETLPVTAAYPYPTWAPGQPSDFYLYKDLRKDPDYAPVRYRAEDYPYMAAEIGGGMMPYYHRRPQVPDNSLDPLINRFLGSGANGIGYYMYHGGSTPRGESTFYSDVAVGVPYISYDYQAPIGEFGQVRPSFHRLKLIHFFLQSFGDRLAPMQAIFPEGNDRITPEDNLTPRFAVRAKDGSGFVFLNNFQDHVQMQDIPDISLSLRTGGEILRIPETGGFILKKDEHAILPFYFNMDGVHLNYSTAQPITKIVNAGETCYIFSAIPGIEPEFSIRKNAGAGLQLQAGCEVSEDQDRFLVECKTFPSEFIATNRNGRSVRIMTVDREMALQSFIVNITGEQRIIFSDALVLQRQDLLDLHILDRNTVDLKIYPRTGSTPGITYGKVMPVEGSGNVLFSTYRVELPARDTDLKIRTMGENRIVVDLPASMPEGMNDLFLKIDYTGDTGMGFLNGNLVADDFYTATPWTVGLKKFMNKPGDNDLVFYFRPMYADAPYLDDLSSPPGLQDDHPELEIRGTRVIQESLTTVHFKIQAE